MLSYIPRQVIALAAALSYATPGIAAKRGMRYSTPITVTLVSLSIHAGGLWSVLLLITGVPNISAWALFLFILTGTLQPVIRLVSPIVATSSLWILLGIWLFCAASSA